MSEFTQDLILALIVSIITAYLTVKLSMRQFYSQRWWEKKAEAYNQIIEILSDLEYHYREGIYELESLPARVIGPNDQKRLFEFYRNTGKSLTKAINLGTYIILDDAANALSKLLSEFSEKDPKVDRISSLKRNCALIKKCLEEIKDCAEKDLKIK